MQRTAGWSKGIGDITDDLVAAENGIDDVAGVALYPDCTAVYDCVWREDLTGGINFIIGKG